LPVQTLQSESTLIADDFSVKEIFEATEIAIKQYLKFSGNNNPIESSVYEVVEKIPGIYANRKRAK